MKKIYILIFSALLFSLMAFITGEHPFILNLYKSLEIYNIRNPEEKIYLITDKPFYKPGETIWFSAFVVNGKDNKISDISEIMHIDLIDTKGKSIISYNLGISNGIGKGEFSLDDDAVGGIYKIQAYTKYMRLFKPKNCFEKDIPVQTVLIPRILMKLDFDRKAYSSNDTVIAKINFRSIENQELSNNEFSYAVMLNGEKIDTKTDLLNASGCANIQFILPDKLESNDGILNITIKHKGSTESISRSIPIVLNKIDLQFFPEGGYCVKNVKTRLAFKAINEFGKPADIEGSVLDENNKIVYNFRSFHDGMGAFDFTPQKDKKYKAIITKPEKIETIYQLPEILPKGFVLNVYSGKDKLKVRIVSPGKEMVHLVAQIKGIIQYTNTLNTKKGENTIEIPTLEFPSGIAQITLFNSKEKPICTRLVYVNKHKLMNISIITDKAKYAPREKVSMKIKTTDENNNPIKANIALSVFDDKVNTFADDKQDNILSYLLLSSDVKGKIEEPAFYFKNDEPKAEEALDYLLMTQGWRRFAWRNILNKDIINMQDFTQFSEKFLIRGIIVNRITKEPAEKIMISDRYGHKSYTGKNGYFEFITDMEKRYQLFKFQADTNFLSNAFFNSYSVNSTYLNHSLNGVIYDAETGEAIENVKVQLSLKKDDRTFTDINGFYSINGIANKQDLVIFSKPGYKTKQIKVEEPIVNCNLEKEEIPVKIVAKGNWKKRKIEIDGKLSVKKSKSVVKILDEEIDNDLAEKKEDEPENFENIDEVANLEALESNFQPISDSNNGIIQQVYETFCINEKPQFPGGDDNLIRYLAENIKYPLEAEEAGIQGVVYIRFMVDKKGDIKNTRVMLGIDSLLDNEALSVVRTLPRYSPAKSNGMPVNTWFIIPIRFVISGYDDDGKGNFYHKDYEICCKSQNLNRIYEAKSFVGCSYMAGDEERDDFRSTVYWNPSIQTNDKGEAEISFLNNEDESTFIAIAEGIGLSGLIGRSEYRYHTQMSFSLDAKIPVYLSFYDKIQIPVNIVNNTDEEIVGNLEVESPQNLEIIGDLPEKISILPNSNKIVYLNYEADNSVGNSKIKISFSSGSVNDFIVKEIRIAPTGFPQEYHLSGNLKNFTGKMKIPDVVEGSLKVEFKAFPNIFADLMEGLQGMIREPSGCFEQTSSTTYPNILALQLMKQRSTNDNKIIETANSYIDKGYKRLIGFETSKKGYEWFGHVPPHEGLTAYGLMEFEDMKTVYPKVDDQMVKRTALWLTGRKDGKGGFMNDQPEHYGWGSHTEVQNAYVVYALSEAGYTNATAELEAAYNEIQKSQDAYRMALIANALFNYNKTQMAEQLLSSLTQKVKQSGFKGLNAEHSITYSYGESLQIETCSLILLAIMKSTHPDTDILNQGMQFLLEIRKTGRFGSTQSTILALKAMCKYFEIYSRNAYNGSIELNVNRVKIGTMFYNSGQSSILTIRNLEKYFNKGTHLINISQEGEKSIPYSFNASWYTNSPLSNKECMVVISTKYTSLSPNEGETDRLTVKLKNKTGKGLPMTIAKIGIPSGLSLQPWQLKEMQEKKVFNFYEVDKNYLVVYYTGFDPNETKEIKLDLKAEVPGSYACPASCAYLYYTDEFKSWCGNEKIEVMK
jgi:TonB family protein